MEKTMFEKFSEAVSGLKFNQALIVNVSSSEGEFNGYKYNNVVLDTVTFDPATAVIRCRREKVKKALFDSIPAEYRPQRGSIVSFGFDRFGGIAEIRVISR